MQDHKGQANRRDKKRKTPDVPKKKTPRKTTDDKRQPLKHEIQCAVCNSGHRTTIEKFYLGGLRCREIAEMMNAERGLDISQKSISGHVSYFGLLRQRKNPALKMVNDLLDRVNVETTTPSQQTMVALLGLQAKIGGEIVERREQKVEVIMDVDERVNRRIENVERHLGIAGEHSKQDEFLDEDGEDED